MKMENDYNLGFILSRYDVVLLDANVVATPFKMYKYAGRLARQQRADVTTRYLEKLIELIDEGNPIYLTKGILDETKKFGMDRIKRRYNNKPHYIRRKYVSLKTIQRNISLKDRLISIVQNNYRVVKFGEDEDMLYKYFLDKFNYLKEEYGISDNDMELLISGLTISQEKLCALLSNDTGILASYYNLKSRMYFSHSKFGFFLTMGTFGFKDPDYYFEKKRRMGW